MTQDLQLSCRLRYFKHQNLQGDISALSEVKLAHELGSLSKNIQKNSLQVAGQPNSRVGAVAELPDDFVLAIVEDVTQMDGMVATRAVILDPFARRGDRLESPLVIIQDPGRRHGRGRVSHVCDHRNSSLGRSWEAESFFFPTRRGDCIPYMGKLTRIENASLSIRPPKSSYSLQPRSLLPIDENHETRLVEGSSTG